MENLFKRVRIPFWLKLLLGLVLAVIIVANIWWVMFILVILLIFTVFRG